MCGCVFLGLIHFFSSRSTAHLESFQNHILMNASKRQALTPRVYDSRVVLAAFHRERPTYRTAEGQQVYVKLSSKVLLYSNSCIFTLSYKCDSLVYIMTKWLIIINNCHFLRLRKKYNKNARRYSLYARKCEKSYGYVPELPARILKGRVTSGVGMPWKRIQGGLVLCSRYLHHWHQSRYRHRSAEVWVSDKHLHTVISAHYLCL